MSEFEIGLSVYAAIFALLLLPGYVGSFLRRALPGQAVPGQTILLCWQQSSRTEDSLRGLVGQALQRNKVQQIDCQLKPEKVTQRDERMALCLAAHEATGVVVITITTRRVESRLPRAWAGDDILLVDRCWMVIYSVNLRLFDGNAKLRYEETKVFDRFARAPLEPLAAQIAKFVLRGLKSRPIEAQPQLATVG